MNIIQKTHSIVELLIYNSFSKTNVVLNSSEYDDLSALGGIASLLGVIFNVFTYIGLFMVLVGIVLLVISYSNPAIQTKTQSLILIVVGIVMMSLKMILINSGLLEISPARTSIIVTNIAGLL